MKPPCRQTKQSFKQSVISKNSAERHTNVSMYSIAVNATTQCKCFNARGCAWQGIEGTPLYSRGLPKVYDSQMLDEYQYHKYDVPH